MASLSSAKTLGGVGAIFVLLFFIPFLPLVGWILILLALKEISEVLQDRSIFDDALLAGILAIVGAVVLSVAFIFLFAFFRIGFFGFWGVIALFWVFGIVSAIFLKRAYDKISPRLNIPSFATAGLLYLIGVITAIIFVGFIILFIAFIFQVIAYFAIPDQPPGPYPGFQPQPPAYPMPPPTMPPRPTMQPPPVTPATQAEAPAEFKFCFKCGARLPRSADFCTSCGAKQS